MTSLSDTNVGAAECVACFMLLGLALCVLFDFLKIVRTVVVRSTVADLICDLAFSVIIAMSLYLLFIALCDGHIRVYLIICTATGFFLWRCTVGRLFLRPAITISVVIANGLRHTGKWFGKSASDLIRLIGRAFVKLAGKSRNIFQKVRKKDLQHNNV